MQLTSDCIDKVLPAYRALLKDLKPIKEDGINPHFKSKFSTLETIWEEIRHIVDSHDLIFSQAAMSIDDKDYMVSTIYHVSGQWMRSYAKIFNEKNNAQGYCAATTYMRRNGVTTLLNLLAEEDDDGNSACEKPNKAAKDVTNKIVVFAKKHKIHSDTKIYEFCMMKAKEKDIPFPDFLNFAMNNEDKFLKAFAEWSVSHSDKA